MLLPELEDFLVRSGLARRMEPMEIPKALTVHGKTAFQCAWRRHWVTETDPWVIDGIPGVYICRPCVAQWPTDFPTQPSRTAWRSERPTRETARGDGRLSDPRGADREDRR